MFLCSRVGFFGGLEIGGKSVGLEIVVFGFLGKSWKFSHFSYLFCQRKDLLFVGDEGGLLAPI
jgi:hypothetical protein